MRTTLMATTAAGLWAVGLVAWWIVPLVTVGWLVFDVLDATTDGE